MTDEPPQPPAGFSARRATLDDAPGILAVGIARDIEDLGEPDYSLDDVREELTDPGLTDALIALEGDEVVASALLAGGDERVNVHPRATGNGVGTWLRERLEECARDKGEPVVRQHVAGANDPARRLLEGAGYEVAQRFWRMTKELSGDEPEPEWPAGARPRPYVPAQDDEAAYALVHDAFKDIPGNVERSFEEWRAQSVKGAQFAPELSTIVEGRGVAVCNRWEDGTGFVAYLAVDRANRGTGLGRALLVQSLQKMREAGLARAALGVNGRNEQATRLYESVGMRVAFRAERYEKPLRRT